MLLDQPAWLFKKGVGGRKGTVSPARYCRKGKNVVTPSLILSAGPPEGNKWYIKTKPCRSADDARKEIGSLIPLSVLRKGIEKGGGMDISLKESRKDTPMQQEVLWQGRGKRRCGVGIY